jgi:uncharacterized protein (TIGR03437 family)
MTRWKCLALFLIFVARIPAASLSVGTASGGAGQSVTLNVVLQAQGAQVSGLQFDISYDKSVVAIAVAAGASTSAAGKSVSTNPLNTGIRVLIVGFNQTLITDGSVAGLTISIAASAPAGNYPLTLSGASGTDASGQTVAVSVTSGAITVAGATSPAVLAIAKTHSANFVTGQSNGVFTVTVSNRASAGSTSGTVAVNENLPVGLSLVSMAGTGWTCSGAICTRSDVLNGGVSYPAIAVTVNVATNAPPTVTNQVTVSGGGATSASASDSVAVTAALVTQTIAFGDLNPVTFGAASFSLSATASSGLPVSFASTTLSVCTVSGSTVLVIAAGTCSITASQPGNGTFAAATPVTRNFSVLKGAQTIVFALLGDVALGTAPITLTATATSGLPTALTSNPPAVCTITGNTLNILAAGTCSVTASQAGNANYLAATPVTRTLTVFRADAPVVFQGGVVPVYSTSTTVQSGSWISIYGSNLAISTTVWKGDFPTSLGGVSVTVNGKPGYLWFVSPAQINLQAPDDATTGSVNVVVTTPTGAFTSAVTLGLASPSLSLLDSKHVAALTSNADGSYDIVGTRGAFPYPTRPVAAGDSLILYGVGFGPTDPSVKSGQSVAAAAATVNPVTVTIGGISAPVAYSGIVGAGLYQINVTVPAGTPAGDQPIRASVSGLQTGAGTVVTIR